MSVDFHYITRGMGKKPRLCVMQVDSNEYFFSGPFCRCHHWLCFFSCTAITFENVGVKSLSAKVSYSIRLKPSSSGGTNEDGDSWRTGRDFAQFEEQGIFNYV